jgi:MFS family permease
MGLIEAAYSLGFLAGPLVGIGVLALSGENYRLVPYIAALISLVPIIISLFIAQETLPPEKRASSGLSFREKLAAKYSPLKQRVVLLLLVLLFIAQFAFVGFVEYFGLYTLFRLGLNVLSVMILFFAAAILIIAVQGWVVDKLSRRYGDRRLTLIGFHVLAVGLILAAFTPSMPVPWYSKSEIVDELTLEATFTGEVMVDPLTTDLPLESGEGYLGIAWFIFSLCLIVIGYGLIVPAIQSRVMANAPEIAGGSLLGVSNAFYKFILISAPLVLGFAFTTFGLTAPFLLEGLLLLLLFWLIGLQLRAET